MTQPRRSTRKRNAPRNPDYILSSEDDLDHERSKHAQVVFDSSGEARQSGGEVESKADDVSSLDDSDVSANRSKPRRKGTRTAKSKVHKTYEESKDVKRSGDDAANAESSNRRSRGISEKTFRQDLHSNRKDLLAGNSSGQDLAALSESARIWGDDLTLPESSSLRYPVMHTAEKREWEATCGWDWYYKGGWRERFARQQDLLPISEAESCTYLGVEHQKLHQVLLGDLGNQKRMNLNLYTPLNAENAFDQADTDSNAGHWSDPASHAWMIYLGAKIYCLDWAPNQDSTAQYLAVATKDPLRSQWPADTAPGFTPAIPSSSCIQIWRVHGLAASARLHAKKDSSLDLNRPPELHQILCTDWSGIKQLRWCPMPRRHPSSLSTEPPFLGLLAVTADDGNVYVLDLQINSKSSTKTSFLKVNHASFVCHPPANSIATCMTWLSATDIAVGYSSGFLAIFSILATEATEATEMGNQSSSDQDTTAHSKIPQPRPQPWLLTQIHQTYVIALAPAYPCFPSLLASTSMSGHVRLMSIADPGASHVQSRRSHHPHGVLLYHHALHGHVFSDDGKDNLAYTGLRFWGNTISFGDTTMQGGILSLDVGKVHATVAYGTADGKVTVCNPMRRILHRKTQAVQQVILQHDWAPRNDEDTSGPECRDQRKDKAAESKQQRSNRSGMARIVGRFKPEVCGIGHRASPLNLSSAANGGRGGMATTIFEDEAGTTALSWNSNLMYGAWLAVGWGDGLLRIENVAI